MSRHLLTEDFWYFSVSNIRCSLLLKYYLYGVEFHFYQSNTLKQYIYSYTSMTSGDII